MAEKIKQKEHSRDEIKTFLDEISSMVAAGSVPTFHTMLALNSLLNLPEAKALFDQELIKQAKEIWANIKLSGVQLVDPPLLFGETEGVSVLLHLEDYGHEGEEEEDLVDGRLPVQSTQTVN